MQSRFYLHLTLYTKIKEKNRSKIDNSYSQFLYFGAGRQKSWFHGHIAQNCPHSHFQSIPPWHPEVSVGTGD